MSKVIPSIQHITIKNPILDIAASFWEDDRYEAFQTCYRSMRLIDNWVDDFKSARAENPEKITASQIRDRIGDILSDILGKTKPAEDENARLWNTIHKFKIPTSAWERLVEAMYFDLEHDGFNSFLQFRRYARGAAVAPAAVFVHLIALEATDNGFKPAPVDVFEQAAALAVFSYMTHIQRDFQRDLQERLEYIPGDWRRHFQISDEEWCAAGAGDQSESFTRLIRAYNKVAEWYRQRAIPRELKVYSYLGEEYRFSLNLIWELYSLIHERIGEAKFQLNPTLVTPHAEETLRRIDKLANTMNFSPELYQRGIQRLERRWRVAELH